MEPTAAGELPKIEFRPLSESSKGAFSCGIAEIDKWFSRSWKKHLSFQSRVTTAHFAGSDEIVAF